MTNADTLTVTTPSDREITLSRVFNAPRELVFDAWTKPELLRRWFNGPGSTLDVCEVDLRVGGRYRYVWKMPNWEMGMGGEFLEVVPPERIVATEKFDQAWYAGEAISTMVFREANGLTTLETTIIYESKETRDAVLASPMAKGFGDGCDRLDALLAELPAAEPSR